MSQSDWTVFMTYVANLPSRVFSNALMQEGKKHKIYILWKITKYSQHVFHWQFLVNIGYLSLHPLFICSHVHCCVCSTVPIAIYQQILFVISKNDTLSDRNSCWIMHIACLKPNWMRRDTPGQHMFVILRLETNYCPASSQGESISAF